MVCCAGIVGEHTMSPAASAYPASRPMAGQLGGCAAHAGWIRVPKSVRLMTAEVGLGTSVAVGAGARMGQQDVAGIAFIEVSLDGLN